jgi:hypothetical protein
MVDIEKKSVDLNKCNYDARKLLGSSFFNVIAPYANLIKARAKTDNVVFTLAYEALLEESDPENKYEYNRLIFSAALAEILWGREKDI